MAACLNICAVSGMWSGLGKRVKLGNEFLEDNRGLVLREVFKSRCWLNLVVSVSQPVTPQLQQ